MVNSAKPQQKLFVLKFVWNKNDNVTRLHARPNWHLRKFSRLDVRGSSPHIIVWSSFYMALKKWFFFYFLILFWSVITYKVLYIKSSIIVKTSKNILAGHWIWVFHHFKFNVFQTNATFYPCSTRPQPNKEIN